MFIVSYAKIVQTERHELARMAEVPPILCKDTLCVLKSKEKTDFFVSHALK